jgi:3-phosphoshikimate 1-carboxyvinyltransferase
MGTTTLTNIKHIRFKESNRVENMVRELRNFGLEIEEDIDSVKIRGNPNIILHTSHTISDIKDHRVLMALIIFAVGIEYEGHRIIIENIENIGDSYPRFVWDLNYQIGAKFDVEEVV